MIYTPQQKLFRILEDNGIKRPIYFPGASLREMGFTVAAKIDKKMKIETATPEQRGDGKPGDYLVYNSVQRGFFFMAADQWDEIHKTNPKIIRMEENSGEY